MSVGSKIFGGGQSGIRQATAFYNALGGGRHFKMRSNYAVNVVTCGDFSCSTGWVLGAGWTISGGVAAYDGTVAGNPLSQVALTVGIKYTVTLDVKSRSQGKVSVGDGTTTAERNSVGQLSLDFTAAGTSLQIVPADDGGMFIGSVDNVVCRVRAV